MAVCAIAAICPSIARRRSSSRFPRNPDISRPQYRSFSGTSKDALGKAIRNLAFQENSGEDPYRRRGPLPGQCLWQFLRGSPHSGTTGPQGCVLSTPERRHQFDCLSKTALIDIGVEQPAPAHKSPSSRIAAWMRSISTPFSPRAKKLDSGSRRSRAYSRDDKTTTAVAFPLLAIACGAACAASMS